MRKHGYLTGLVFGGALGLMMCAQGVTAFAATGWEQTAAGYYYNDPSTGARAVGWKKIDDKWYYFKQDGIMATGLIYDNGKYYYTLDDGTMVKGWLKIGDQYYYMRSDGSMLTGWRQMDGAWYYFDPASGVCAANGSREIDGKWYLFGTDCKMLTGWQKVNGDYYYFSTEGVMLTGWLSDGTNRYYMDPANGKMVVNDTRVIDGVSYQFDAKGVCGGNAASAGTSSQTSSGGSRVISAGESYSNAGPGVR